MYFLIIISSLLSFFYTFKERICDFYRIHGYEFDKCLIEYKKDIERDKIINKINYIINILFSLEMLIKILAKGLILHKFTYLRNGWNIIDCFICIYQWFKIYNEDWGNLYVFRCLKFIGIMKDMTYLSGLSKLVNSIIISLPTLGRVFLFLIFVILIFAILGIQLFNGIIYNRCREYPIKINDDYNNTGIPYYQSIPVNDRICSPKNYTGSFQCPKNSFCVNFFDIVNYFKLNTTMESFKRSDENLNQNIWLHFGLLNFDNLISSLISSFSFITLQNWSNDLTKFLDGCSKSSTILYFNSIIILGGFFIIKLCLSAQYDAMKTVIKEEIKDKLNIFKKKKSDLFFINKKTMDPIDFKKDKINCFKSLKSSISKSPVRSSSKFIKLNSISNEDINYNGNTSNHLKSNYSNYSNSLSNNLGINLNKKMKNFLEKKVTFHAETIKKNTNDKISIKHNINKKKKNNYSMITKVKQIIIEKIKYMILDEYSNTFEFIIFNTFIYLIITINIIFICLLKYPMNNKLENIIKVINIICTSILILEIIIKFIVLGFKNWIKDKFNIIDFIIIILGLYEIIYVKITKDILDDANSSLCSLRAIRYIKLLRYFGDGGFLNNFVNFFIISLKDLFYYCILLFFFIVIFAIAGIELFANSVFIYDKKDEYNYYYSEIIPPRENFNNIQNALVTVFIILIGNNWPNTLYEYSKIYKKSSRFYFISTIIICHIILLNLFLSILITNYQKENEIVLFDNKKDTKKADSSMNQLASKIKGFWYKLYDGIKNFFDCCIKEKKNRKQSQNSKRRGIIEVGINSSENFSKNIKHMTNKIKIERTSLMLFSPTNKFRILCSNIIQERKWFKFLIIINISISLFIMAFDSPYQTNRKKKLIIYIIDSISTFIFLIEVSLKSISFGFLFNGENSYLRYEYNCIDFCSLILSIIYLILTVNTSLGLNSQLDKNKQLGILRIIKLFRLVRINKLIGLSKSLKATLKAYYKSLFQLLKLILIELLIILIFDIIGVNYFRGRFSRCDFSNIPREYMSIIKTKWDCLDYGGDWITIYPNLDNIKSGFILFFEMMTTEGWVKYMYIAMDSTDIDKQPIRDISFRWALFFVCYMIFSFFFLFNLVIVILSDNYYKEKEKIENFHYKLPIQNEFYKIFKNLFKVEIPKKKVRGDSIIKVLIKILDSAYFEAVISVCIIANLFTLILEYPGQDEISKTFLSELNMIISYIFLIEAILRIYVYRLYYFKNGWNLIDFIVVCEFLITLSFQNYVSFLNDELETTIFKILRVGRVLKLLRRIKSLRKVLNLFFNSIPGVLNVLILYFITIYIYAIIGMNLFYDLKYQEIISEKWNFQNFINSILILIRITSGGDWNTLMHESTNDRNGFFDCKYNIEMTNEELYKNHYSCGTMLGFPYYISFIILSMIMFLDFFSAVISCAMDDTYVMNLEEMKTGDINKFKKKWASVDKKCTGFMKLDQLQKFTYIIGHPLGINSIKINDFIRICSLLKIYTYSYQGEQYVFFYDVLIELSKYYLIHKTVEDEYNNANSIYQNIEEVIEFKSESLIKYINSINDMQKDHFFQILNPYYLNKKYCDVYKINEITKNKEIFNSNDILTVSYSWAIKKLITFTKCYKFMKAKTIKIIKVQQFKMDLIDYVIQYSRKIMIDINNSKLKGKYKKIVELYKIEESIIHEENSNSNIDDNENSNNQSLNSSSSLSSSSSNHFN